MNGFGFTNFVKADQTLLNGKDLLNCCICEQIALQISDDLMSGNDSSIVFIRLEFQRLKLHLNYLILIRPVFAHRVTSGGKGEFVLGYSELDEAAFSAKRNCEATVQGIDRLASVLKWKRLSSIFPILIQSPLGTFRLEAALMI